MHCIIGNNITAKTLFLLLNSANIDVILLQKPYNKEENSLYTERFSTRTMAITAPNLEILSKIVNITEITENAGKIKEIHVFNSVKSILPEVVFKAAKFNHNEFGYIVNYLDLHRYIDIQMEKFAHKIHNPVEILQNGENFTITTDANLNLSCKDLIITDKTCNYAMKFNPSSKQKFAYNYQESAITLNISHKIPHNGVAIEKFTSSGPLACLPCANSHNSNIVSTIPAQMAWDIKQMSQEKQKIFIQSAILKPLQQYFGNLEIISEIAIFPLHLKINTQPDMKNIAFCGAENFTMHPIAGQGFNLALRDLQRMCNILQESGNINLFKEGNLGRKLDISSMLFITHNLNQMFKIKNRPFTTLRKNGMKIVNNCRFLTSHLTNNAIGTGIFNKI